MRDPLYERDVRVRYKDYANRIPVIDELRREKSVRAREQ